jgi:hypothetical protein
MHDETVLGFLPDHAGHLLAPKPDLVRFVCLPDLESSSLPKEVVMPDADIEQLDVFLQRMPDTLLLPAAMCLNRIAARLADRAGRIQSLETKYTGAVNRILDLKKELQAARVSVARLDSQLQLLMEKEGECQKSLAHDVLDVQLRALSDNRMQVSIGGCPCGIRHHFILPMPGGQKETEGWREDYIKRLRELLERS